MPQLVVATFNIHAGVDGWGRPHDVVGACRQLDADVLVLQESWAPDGAASVAAAVADQLGYRCYELAVAHGRLFGPHPAADSRWGPRPWLRRLRTLLLHQPVGGGRSEPPDQRSPRPAGAGRARRRHQQGRSSHRGAWGVAVLSRLPVLQVRHIDLGQLPRDQARRKALACTVDVDGVAVTVVGTHMSHLSHGSPLQFRRLARALPPTSAPAVVAGDMNLWGPPVSALMPRWRRAVRGRTWPAWRPLAQIDHVLVSAAVQVEQAEVVAVGGSDHRPIRCRLAVGRVEAAPAR